MLAGSSAPFDTCSLVALLMGSGACLSLSCLAGRFDKLFATAHAGRLVTGLGFFCLAVGALIPQRAARYLGLRWRHGPLERPPAADDVALLWTVLALVSLLCGLTLAAVPLALPLAQGGYGWLLERFLWSPSSLSILQSVTVVAVLLPGLALLGLGMACTCRLACGACHWRVSPMGWALVGAGLGSGLTTLLPRTGASREALTGAAAVPVLLAAVVAARRMGSPVEGGRLSALTVSPAIPSVRDRWPMLLRASVAWVAASTAAAVAVWVQVPQCWPIAAARGTGGALMSLPAIMGAGVVVCDLTKASRLHSAGGFGVASVVAGVGLAASCSIPAVWLTDGSRVEVPALMPLLGGGLSAVIMGYVLAYGHRTVLCRAGSRAASGAALLALSLAAAAVVVLLIGQSPVSIKASYATLAGIAISLVALGGTTIIHEPTYSRRTRRRRLAAVFASIALMIFVLPIAGRRWSGSVSSNRVAGGQLSAMPVQMPVTLGAK
jgi:hypothetical protein